MESKTKIVATIGPASNSREILEKLILAGMNVARLNFSHGSHEDHNRVVNIIRSLSRTLNRPVGILLDLQGPKIRVGTIENGGPIQLNLNDEFTITSKKIQGSDKIVSTTYTAFADDVNAGDTILLDDGLIKMKVLSIMDDAVKLKVIRGGYLKEKKGINLPGVNVSAPSLTEKDIRDVKFGIQNNVDYFALSFVRSARDLRQIKEIIARQGASIPVIAKIEKPEAVENLEAVLDASDGIMVARGDLGVEMQPELVPTIQKQTILSSIQKNKSVITATQMLETMSVNPIPTRAEASDVANAIFDGTDAIMLSGETASGKYPVQSVRMMNKIAVQSEQSPFMRYNIHYEKDPKDLITHAVAQSAVNILHEIHAKCIVAFSISGATAKQISKQRPSEPIYAFTSRMDTYNRLSLVWGVSPMYIPEIDETNRLALAGERILLQKKCVEKGDLIVLIIGRGLKAGSTNIIKIHQIGYED